MLPLNRILKWLWASHTQTKVIISTVLPSLKNVPELSTGLGGGSSNTSVVGNNYNAAARYTKTQLSGLLLGPLSFCMILLFFRPHGLGMDAIATLGIASWVAIWWISEAIPIPVTSLLPIVLYPLTGAMPADAAYAPYANGVIFLILGGFVLALTMERWGLHKRIAFMILSLCGTKTRNIVLGFIIATGFLSMWISNTASAMLMIPMALALIQHAERTLEAQGGDAKPQVAILATILLLGIAYAASAGGISTMVSTPANLILVGMADQLFGFEINYLQWLSFGLPVAVILLLLVWVFLTSVVFRLPFDQLPGGVGMLKAEKAALGRVTPEEKIILVIFLATAFFWSTRSLIWNQYLPGLSDAIIAITAALALCIIPAPTHRGERMFDWKLGQKLPWGILLLYGCGLSLALGFIQTGLSGYFGSQLVGLSSMSTLTVVFIVVAIVVFMTELMSNGASASMLYPIMGVLATSLHAHPLVFMMAACLATSAAFMLPVSTPPNAIVFATGHVKMKEMIKAGMMLNLVVIVLAPLAAYFLLPMVWGIDLHTAP